MLHSMALLCLWCIQSICYEDCNLISLLSLNQESMQALINMRRTAKEKELEALLSGENDSCSCFVEVYFTVSHAIYLIYLKTNIVTPRVHFLTFSYSVMRWITYMLFLAYHAIISLIIALYVFCFSIFLELVKPPRKCSVYV